MKTKSTSMLTEPLSSLFLSLSLSLCRSVFLSVTACAAQCACVTIEMVADAVAVGDVSYVSMLPMGAFSFTEVAHFSMYYRYLSGMLKFSPCVMSLPCQCRSADGLVSAFIVAQGLALCHTIFEMKTKLFLGGWV